jgi:hypothetical protein
MMAFGMAFAPHLLDSHYIEFIPFSKEGKKEKLLLT